jgi:lysophospholipid acyltransferase (LPLAT)-like uncharacterized protein
MNSVTRGCSINMTNDSQATQTPNHAASAEPQPVQGHPLKFKVMLWCLYIFCRVLSATWRIRISGMDRRRRAVESGRTNGILIASFHENAAAGVLSHQGQPICQMISRSKDGEMVAFIGEKMGYLPIRGSSSRGSKEARNAMAAAVASGHIGAITVDGPRGPRRILKNGIVDIARKTGAPVIPTTCVGSNMWILRKTWDQTRIPKPFSRVLVHYGEPFIVPANTVDDQFLDFVDKLTLELNQNDDLVRLRFDELWDTARP